MSSSTVTGGFSQQNSECFGGGPIPPGGGCYFNAIFDPIFSPGLFTGTLSIFDNAPDSPQTVSLKGKATALKYAPSKIRFESFAPGQSSPTQQVTITNVWTSPVTISQISFSGTGAADFAIGNQTCLTVLAAAASCTFDVTFTPSALANEPVKMIVNNDEPGGPDEVHADGDGTYLEVRPFLVTFPAENTTATLINTGTSPITITGMSITGPARNFASITGTSCGQSLDPGNKCTVSLRFMKGGARYAELLITDSDPGSPQRAILAGPR